MLQLLRETDMPQQLHQSKEEIQCCVLTLNVNVFNAIEERKCGIVRKLKYGRVEVAV